MEAAFSDRMGCLEMDPDGRISCRIIEEDEVMEDFGLQLIWNQFNRGQGNIRGVMSDGENTYAFMFTDVRMVPELDLIRGKLRDNKRRHAEDDKVSLTGEIRTRSESELYLKTCTDVLYGFDRGDCYYFVGVRSQDVKLELHWSAGLMRIRSLEGRKRTRRRSLT